jgi:hypothetical protein
MDYSTIALSIVGGLLGIGGIGVSISGFLTKYTKYVMLAKDAVETLADAANALKDGQLSADELTSLKAAAEAVRAKQADVQTL